MLASSESKQPMRLLKHGSIFNLTRFAMMPSRVMRFVKEVAQWGRFTVFRWGSKIFLTPATCQLSWVRRFHLGRRPAANATVVDKLLEAGAVIMGKTVTTEFAFSQPARTANPHTILPTHTGGSSSGSAAAVGAHQIPLALGSQTNGSTIRPASFLWRVWVLSPTRGMISRRGVLETSHTLDQVGVFARSAEDVALLGDVLAGYDPADAMCFLRARPKALDGVHQTPPVEPRLVWFELPFAERLSPASVRGFEEVLKVLGARVERFPAPQSYPDLVKHHRVIHEYEIARCLEYEAANHWALLSEQAKAAVKKWACPQ